MRDLARESSYPESATLARELGLQSFCMLPLTTIVRPLGAIGFGCARGCGFDEEELGFLRLVATQVAVAVDNVLHHESDKSAREALGLERDRLRLLLDVSESIASYRDLPELFEVLSRRLPRMVPFDFINLVAARSGRATSCGCRSSYAPRSQHRSSRAWRLPVDESPAGLVWKTQQPVMVEDSARGAPLPALIARLMPRTACSPTAWCP